jgi:hypothetical protein
MERSDATPWLSAMIAALAIFMFSLGKVCEKMQDRNSQSSLWKLDNLMSHSKCFFFSGGFYLIK